jgi:LuxR family quorum sensing-dependent transcriptional regulator
MAGADEIADRADSLRTAPDLAELERRFAGAIARHGFNASACGAFVTTRLGPAPVFYFQNWPRDWLERYMAEGFVEHDFGVAEARASVEPFAWSEAFARRRLSAGERRIWQAVQDRGWVDGFSVPIHGPGGYFGLVTMAGVRPLEDRAVRHGLATLARTAHDRARRLAGPLADEAEPLAEPLTARELACLRWVAAGLEDPAIARELGVSRNTVKDHLTNARRKLKADTRAQAVARALVNGLM